MKVLWCLNEEAPCIQCHPHCFCLHYFSVSGYRYFQQARSGCSAPWPAHICWTLHFTISRCHRRKKKNSSKPRAGIVSITWRSVYVCISVYIYEIRVSVCIWDLCMVRTDNYGKNASDSVGYILHTTSSSGFFLCFCFLGWLVGWFGQFFLFFSFPSIGNSLWSCL